MNKWLEALWQMLLLWYCTYRTIVLIHEGDLFWASVMAFGAMFALLNLNNLTPIRRDAKEPK